MFKDENCHFSSKHFVLKNDLGGQFKIVLHLFKVTLWNISTPKSYKEDFDTFVTFFVFTLKITTGLMLSISVSTNLLMFSY